MKFLMSFFKSANMALTGKSVVWNRHNFFLVNKELPTTITGNGFVYGTVDAVTDDDEILVRFNIESEPAFYISVPKGQYLTVF